jgi:Tfp pilus assembly protein PilO
MIERLNGRTSVAIAVAGLLLVVLVGWMGFVTPQRSKAADLSVKIGETQTQLAVTQALVDGPLLRQSTAELATLRTAIPDDIRMSQLLRQLSKTSADASVRILGITPTPVATVGVADTVVMNVTIEGRYFAIRDFLRILRSRADIRLNKVHASGRLFAVETIVFSRGAGEGSSLIQATLTISAYAFNRPAAVTSTTPGGPLSSGATAQTGSEASGP